MKQQHQTKTIYDNGGASNAEVMHSKNVDNGQYESWPWRKQQHNGGDKIEEVADSINVVHDELNIIQCEY